MDYAVFMSLKKKKNVILITVCMISCFILYQMYFFLTLSSETRNLNQIIPVIDFKSNNKQWLIRSKADRFIKENGVIHGVYYKSMPLYRPDAGEFKCLHSDKKIPYDQVNDDYCDCEDSTDEPSTRACVNGTFYCDTQNIGRTVLIHKISSSKVNDGICDCCDGSDEWLHKRNEKLLSQASSNHRRLVSKCQNLC